MAGAALEREEIRDLLVEGFFAQDETYRYNCVRVVFRALEKEPGLFYPYWERFAGMLDHPNGFFRSAAAQVVAYLAAADKERRLDAILDAYLNILDDEKIMVARYFAQTIHLVAKARPDLREKIVARLLDVDATHHAEDRKDLLKADVIGALDQIYDTLSPREQEKALALAQAQLECSSPTTRKIAKAFLEKYQP